MCTVSVILPIYNVEKYLDKCINTVLEQTYKDFEIILVDDGSPDNCPKICDEYAEKYDFVKVVHKENGGLSDARNAGMKLARGKYYCFIDSDDYVKPNLLEKTVSTIEETGADMVIYNFWSEAFPGDGMRSHFDNGIYEFNTENDYLEFICHKWLDRKIGWETWNKLFRASVIKENNLSFYNNKEIYAEDLQFAIFYLLNSKKIAVIDDVLYHYVIRADSITGQNKATKINEYVEFNYVLNNYIKEKGYKYLLDNYYILFYTTMNNRYMQSDKEDCLKDIKKLKRPEFFRKYTKQAIMHPKEVALHQGYKYTKQILKENIEFYLKSLF